MLETGSFTQGSQLLQLLIGKHCIQLRSLEVSMLKDRHHIHDSQDAADDQLVIELIRRNEYLKRFSMDFLSSTVDVLTGILTIVNSIDRKIEFDSFSATSTTLSDEINVALVCQFITQCCNSLNSFSQFLIRNRACGISEITLYMNEVLSLHVKLRPSSASLSVGELPQLIHLCRHCPYMRLEMRVITNEVIMAISKAGNSLTTLQLCCTAYLNHSNDELKGYNGSSLQSLLQECNELQKLELTGANNITDDELGLMFICTPFNNNKKLRDLQLRFCTTLTQNNCY